MDVFSVLLALQYVGIAILIIGIVCVIKQKPSQLQNLILLVLMATLINYTGYLFEIKSDNRDMALMAVKFMYMGKPFIALGTLLFAFEFYRIRILPIIRNILCTIHILITLLVLTCESHNLYYSSIDYTYEGLFPHLVFGHSIIYTIYNRIIIMSYLIIIVYLGIRNYKLVQKEAERKSILIMSGISFVPLTGLLIYMTGITRGYDTTEPSYVISCVLLMILMFKYDIFDTLTLAKDDIIDEFESGIIVVDERNRIIYFNQKASDIYADMENESKRVNVEQLDRMCKKNEKLHIGREIYEIHGKKIIRNKNFYGNAYIVTNVTDSYEYTVNLEKQKAIAESANKAKTDFLARMSHEIRTPINAVLGMNEMILRESTEPGIKKYAMNVKTSANSLLGIINDILDSTKIESGKMEIIPVEYELDSLLNDTVNMIYVRAKDKKLDFNIEVDEELPNKLYGDDVRIRQVLLNLLTNAVKYTPEGSVTFSVAGKRIGSNIIMKYTVKDTGIGIKKEDMSKLFESFERIEEDRNRNIEGTGLGMNIVMNLLKMMGTDLKVESEYGKGTTFSFELEQKVISDNAIGNFRERVERLGEEYTYKSLFTAPKARVLVVDDNDINRMVFSCMLLSTQMQIVEASSGVDALKLVTKEHFDIIFLDHMMPELDGVETLKRMKTMENNLCKDTPVIILTANAVTGAKEQYLAEGFDEYLSKPVVPEKLERMIKDLLPKEYLE